MFKEYPSEVRNKLKVFFSSLGLKKKDYWALLLIAMYIFLFFKPVAAGDGIRYYSILEGVVRDQTFNFERQARFNGINQLHFATYNNITQKYVVHNAAFGLPMLSAPLYAVSLFLDDFEIFHIKDAFFLKERKSILIHQASIPLTTLIFVIVAILLSIIIIKKYYFKELAVAAVLITFFSSSLPRYATYDASYTHGVEAGLMAILILLILRDSSPFIIGGLVGLMTTVRYTSPIFLLPIGVYYLYKNRQRDIVKLSLGAMPFLFLIMGYWSYQFGSPFSSGYIVQYSLNIPRYISRMLFDLDRGILFWTPNLLIAVFGLFLLKDDKKWLFIGFIFSYLIGYAVMGPGRWDAGDGYGIRWFVVLFPIFCIGMASAMENRPRLKPVIYFFALYSGVLSLLYTAYSPSSFLAQIDFWIINRQILNFPMLIIKKVGLVRLILGY